MENFLVFWLKEQESKSLKMLQLTTTLGDKYKMKKLKLLGGMTLVIALFASQGVLFPTDSFKVQDANASGIEVWWPTENANLTGVQPFKAMLPGYNVNDYHMFWYVDGGEWNWMDTNWQDYPHKEVPVDVSGWNWRGEGPYSIGFVAVYPNGNKITERTVSVYINRNINSEPETATEKIEEESSTEEPQETEDVYTSQSKNSNDKKKNVSNSDTSNPFSEARFFIDPNSPARAFADQWRWSNPYGASMLDKIASQPGAKWFGGWNADIYGDVKNATDAAVAQGALPVFIAYNIPQRDCGSYSAGGAGSPSQYEQWISNFARGIGSNKAVVVLEPDALTGMDCLSSHDRDVRMSLLRNAVDVFNRSGNVSVYIDAGHARWLSTADAANRLRQAGVDNARGFSLNVSNYIGTSENVRYGESISSLLGGKNFVVDTSRNGLGPTWDNQWCNPGGRALGEKPTANTGNHLVDAYFWFKVPGESDGTCNGGPSAGVFWPEYAVGLSERAQW